MYVKHMVLKLKIQYIGQHIEELIYMYMCSVSIGHVYGDWSYIYATFIWIIIELYLFSNILASHKKARVFASTIFVPKTTLGPLKLWKIIPHNFK